MTKIFHSRGLFRTVSMDPVLTPQVAQANSSFPVAGSGSRYLNGVNSFSGGVGEHDTPADATATLSPPCQQRR